jgi:phage tail sheath gpL-like
MVQNKIPGVYSNVDASAALKSLSANDYVIGIVAKGAVDDTVSKLTEKAYAPFSFEDAKQRYGEDSNIAKIMGTAIDNGGSKFIVVRVDDATVPATPDYVGALEVLEMEEAVDIVISDTMNPSDFVDIKNHVNNASQNRNERIAIVGYDVNTDITTVTTNAKSVNSPRVLSAYSNPLDKEGNELPGYYTAAAIAGALANESDPSMPMTGVELKGFYGLAKKLKISEMTTLIDAGIIPLESRNGVISIVRCITTYTKDADNNTDITWQEVTTVRISDYVFKDLRSALARKFKRAKQGSGTRDAVKSEVLTRLLKYQELEYIEEVSSNDVSIQINPSNPLQNDVDFNYNVTGPQNIINLTGHLTV